jgi:hypothetical protein
MNVVFTNICVWLYDDLFGFKVYFQDLFKFDDRENQRIRSEVGEAKGEFDSTTERITDTTGSDTGINVAGKSRWHKAALRYHSRPVQPVLVGSGERELQ